MQRPAIRSSQALTLDYTRATFCLQTRAGRLYMPKALTILGMIVAILLLIVFALDLAIGIPFSKASRTMDIAFVICALLLGYLSWATLREQP
jgi:hypothetical protein